jgi:hypothetical protein
MASLKLQTRITPGGGNGNHVPPGKKATASSGDGRGGVVTCLADSEAFGYSLCLPHPWVLLGLGTTGTGVVQTAMRFLADAAKRIPRACRHLTIDAAPTFHPEHLLQHIQIGTDGAGTNPHNGRRLFFEHYDLIRHALQEQIDELCRGAADFVTPAMAARQVTGFMIVAGCGGTSGGTLDPMISLVHDVAQRRSIQEVRVHIVLLGPGMPLRDSSRQPLPEQIRLIQNTYAQNLLRIYGLKETPGFFREIRPDGTDFYVEASRRVTGIDKVDYTNGLADFATTDELVEMVGHAAFTCLLTHAGEHASERKRDHDGIGATGRHSN